MTVEWRLSGAHKECLTQIVQKAIMRAPVLRVFFLCLTTVNQIFPVDI